jgi:hypothetical protein
MNLQKRIYLTYWGFFSEQDHINPCLSRNPIDPIDRSPRDLEDSLNEYFCRQSSPLVIAVKSYCPVVRKFSMYKSLLSLLPPQNETCLHRWLTLTFRTTLVCSRNEFVSWESRETAVHTNPKFQSVTQFTFKELGKWFLGIFVYPYPNVNELSLLTKL